MITDRGSTLNPEDHDHQSFADYGIPDLPTFEREFVHAKAFLQKCSSVTGDNLYDHLSNCLNQILAERPKNVVDYFEEYSRNVKQKRFKPLTDHLQDVYMPPDRFKSAETRIPLFSTLKPGEASSSETEEHQVADMRNNNLLRMLYYLEQTGIGLPKTEMLYINLSMKQLIMKEPIVSIRFWGKIFGIKKNYIIVECLLKPDEYAKRNEKDQTTISEERLSKQEIDEEIQEPSDWPPFPPLPKIIFEEPKDVPPEASGIGVNKYVYYVCNEPGEEWIQLPDVKPNQIQIARQILKIFTGDLDQEIITYPEFPGKEREYLRVQIARISASTQISPLGFYNLDQDSKMECVENPEYEPLSVNDLIDKSMKFWVHHSLNILEQGRTTLWNPNEEPEEEQEDGEEINESKPKTGPALLTPCSQDNSIYGILPWSVYSSSNLLNEDMMAVVRSNFWPGAYSIATQNKQFYNIYFGNGTKITTPNFSPLPLPPVAKEYSLESEIIEITDPTGIEEKQEEKKRSIKQ